MTQDEIIEMPPYLNAAYEGDDLFTGKQLRAAVLAEREACAQTCENLPIPNQFSESEGSIWDVAALDCAAAIRARGEQA